VNSHVSERGHGEGNRELLSSEHSVLVYALDKVPQWGMPRKVTFCEE
jgi:hypothetical protein